MHVLSRQIACNNGTQNLRAASFVIGLVALGLCAAAALTRLEAQGAERQRGVVELFTSQGCSSCPPADELLGKLARRDDVIALTLPVDYWDYLGWKDTLALPLFTERQRSYALTRGDGQVYTPQVVVNGMSHVNGSQEQEIEAALTRTRAKLARKRIPLRAWNDDAGVVVEAGAAPEGMAETSASILVALVQKRVEVAIGRGENQGRRLTYTNVVRDLKVVGTWTGAARTFRLAKAELGPVQADFCIVLVQLGQAGPMIAAIEVR